MNTTNNLIDKTINGLDWKKIISVHLTLTQVDCTKQEMMKELREKIMFLIEGNIRELRTMNWLIIYKNLKSKDNKIKKSIEVFYIVNGISCEMSDDLPEIKERIVSIETEINVLNGMMERALKSEQYELCSVIRRRIKSILEK